jgi:hypothetical protein
MKAPSAPSASPHLNGVPRGLSRKDALLFVRDRAECWRTDFPRFCAEALRIRDKEARLVPLILNDAQHLLLEAAERQVREEGWVRIIGLKGRRQGFSTVVAARGYWRATLWPRQHVHIMAHELAGSSVLFDMVALMQRHHPFPPATGTDNARTLEFTRNQSVYHVATAGQKAGGRGRAVSFFHGSEVSRWANAPEHFAASVQSVDEVRQQCDETGRVLVPPSEVWLESTSAGPSGEFYHRFLAAERHEGRYRAVFVPWTVQKEYRLAAPPDPAAPPAPGATPAQSREDAEYARAHGLDEAQMRWRHEKIAELGGLSRFQQEYPATVPEAFSAVLDEAAFIPAPLVHARRANSGPNPTPNSDSDIPDAPLILGVDPAGSGGDRFAVALRRGNKILALLSRSRLDHNDAVAFVAELQRLLQPARINIDRGNIGGPLITTLTSMDPDLNRTVRGVDFGSPSIASRANLQRAVPQNRRAEIWGRMKEFLEDPQSSIPDDDDLVADLTAPRIKYRQNGNWLLEAKTDMRARGIRSPDLGDAVALTFASRETFPAPYAPPGRYERELYRKSNPPATGTPLAAPENPVPDTLLPSSSRSLSFAAMLHGGAYRSTTPFSSRSLTPSPYAWMR